VNPPWRLARDIHVARRPPELIRTQTPEVSAGP
jgi:hypothetical protein